MTSTMRCRPHPPCRRNSRTQTRRWRRWQSAQLAAPTNLWGGTRRFRSSRGPWMSLPLRSVPKTCGKTKLPLLHLLQLTSWSSRRAWDGCPAPCGAAPPPYSGSCLVLRLGRHLGLSPDHGNLAGGECRPLASASACACATASRPHAGGAGAGLQLGSQSGLVLQ